MQNTLTSILNSIPDDSTEASSKQSFLSKKKNRLSLPITNPSAICSICLESDKYTLTKCIKCSSCGALCHIQCYIDYISPKLNLNNFICSSCIDYKDTKCSLCFDHSGIIKKITNTIYSHYYCSKFIKEIHDDQRIIRKWRMKNKCKICQNKKSNSDGIPVIKCNNTKCKNYYHISCAIQHGLIFSLTYMKDFYKIDASNEEIFPFYCNLHNRNLIKDYIYFTSQMDFALQDKGNYMIREEDNVKIKKLEEKEENEKQFDISIKNGENVKEEEKKKKKNEKEEKDEKSKENVEKSFIQRELKLKEEKKEEKDDDDGKNAIKAEIEGLKRNEIKEENEGKVEGRKEICNCNSVNINNNNKEEECKNIFGIEKRDNKENEHVNYDVAEEVDLFMKIDEINKNFHRFRWYDSFNI